MVEAPNFYISVFAGAAGLDLAVRLAIPDAQCVCLCEREIGAARILASRMEDGSLEDVPIWSDALTFPSELFCGRVAGVVGGFPCPDYSVAGKRAGIVGEHGQLWNAMRRIIRDVRAEWVLLENVPGILVPHRIHRWRWDRLRRTWSQYLLPFGLWFILGDLAEMGFDAEWGCVKASDVGAPHKRERWYCLAYRPGGGCRKLRQPSGRNGFVRGHGKRVEVPELEGPSCTGAEIGRGAEAGDASRPNEYLEDSARYGGR